MWGQWEGLSTPQQVPTQPARAVSKSWAKEVKVCVPVWVCAYVWCTEWICAHVCAHVCVPVCVPVCAHVWVSLCGCVHTCGAQSGYVLVCAHSIGVCTCVHVCMHVDVSGGVGRETAGQQSGEGGAHHPDNSPHGFSPPSGAGRAAHHRNKIWNSAFATFSFHELSQHPNQMYHVQHEPGSGRHMCRWDERNVLGRRRWDRALPRGRVSTLLPSPGKWDPGIRAQRPSILSPAAVVGNTR